MTKLLLEYKADSIILDSNGRTSLHTAAFHDDNTEIIRLLFEYGADVNKKVEDGQTALELAVERGYHQVAEQLR
ncbi:MAG: ankyrin repeat domain-containing protein [Bacillaceae bacterium]